MLKPVLFGFLFLELLVPGHHLQPDVLTMLGWKVILFPSGACMLDCWLSRVTCSVPWMLSESPKFAQDGKIQKHCAYVEGCESLWVCGTAEYRVSEWRGLEGFYVCRGISVCVCLCVSVPI